MMDPKNDPLKSALRDWAEEQGAREIVRIPPGLMRLKACLAREDARLAKVKYLQRWTLSLVAVVALASIVWLQPQGALGFQLPTFGGLSSLLPLLMAPAVFTASVVWLLED